MRFAGFGNSHDEWVNVREGVRERSIPLEASECHKVKVGDLVLCYQVPFWLSLSPLFLFSLSCHLHVIFTFMNAVQERPDYAVYTDAHVLEIQRRLHDIKGCRCIFVVRFDEDKTVVSSMSCSLPRTGVFLVHT